MKSFEVRIWIDGAESALLHNESNKSSSILLYKALSAPSIHARALNDFAHLLFLDLCSWSKNASCTDVENFLKFQAIRKIWRGRCRISGWNRTPSGVHQRSCNTRCWLQRISYTNLHSKKFIKWAIIQTKRSAERNWPNGADEKPIADGESHYKSGKLMQVTAYYDEKKYMHQEKC